MTVRVENSGDAAGIRMVVCSAFGGAEEADLVDSLRASGDLLLSLVAEENGEIIGHIGFSRLRLKARTGPDGPPKSLELDYPSPFGSVVRANSLEGTRAAALAPMAVLPGRQSRGVGSAMVREGLRLLLERGEQAVFVLGHRDYYPRFGFCPDLAAKFRSRYAGPSFFALELQPGALSGVGGEVQFAPAFELF